MAKTTLRISTLRVGYTANASVKYAYAKRKLMQIESNVKNPLRRF